MTETGERVQFAHWALTAVGAVLLLWSAVRWRRSTPWHSDYTARRDMALLSLLLLTGVVGDAVRTRFVELSPGYLITSAVLIPVAIGGLVLLFRLVKAYRATREADDTQRQGRRER